VTNDAGMVVTSHEYLPFGEDWITEGDTKNAPKYNSQELDKESGYYFYNARHYDPEIGRFVTPDTVVDGELSTQGWNRYAYVHNNPIRYKDPTGHNSLTNWLSGKGWVDDKTAAWGEKQENNILSNFKSDSRLDTEKKVAEMEAQGLKTDKLQTKLTDMRNKAACNRPLNQVESALLKQYKDELKEGPPDFGSPLTTLTNEKQLKSRDEGGIITSFFGNRANPFTGEKEFHPGTDLSAKEHTGIKAMEKGIAYYGYDDKHGGGYFTAVQHRKGYTTVTCHQNEDDWKKYSAMYNGKTVDKGTIIGGVGSTGTSTNSHAHVNVLRNGQVVNPEPILRKALEK